MELAVLVGLVMGAIWWEAASARDKYQRRMYELFDENQELRIFFATMTQREPKFFEKKLAFDYYKESVIYVPPEPLDPVPPPIPR